MIVKVKYIDWGLIEYSKAWNQQESILQNIIDKRDNDKGYFNHLLFCEHLHVYTLGKSGKENNLLINQEFLKKINATYFRSNRGGDITYHGPGQIVGYPIFDLNDFNIGVKKYIYLLEESIIQTLNEFGIKAGRLQNATGVWIDVEKPKLTRKICAIGVRVSKQVTMHGFALNINTNLEYFKYINACGYTDKGVTSLQEELNKKLDINEVKTILKNKIKNIFMFEFV